MTGYANAKEVAMFEEFVVFRDTETAVKVRDRRRREIVRIIEIS